jgi:hypothetical protein
MNRGTATTPQLDRLRELRQLVTTEADMLDDLIIEHSTDLTAFEAHVVAQQLNKALGELRSMVNTLLDVRHGVR